MANTLHTESPPKSQPPLKNRVRWNPPTRDFWNVGNPPLNLGGKEGMLRDQETKTRSQIRGQFEGHDPEKIIVT